GCALSVPPRARSERRAAPGPRSGRAGDRVRRGRDRRASAPFRRRARRPAGRCRVARRCGPRAPDRARGSRRGTRGCAACARGADVGSLGARASRPLRGNAVIFRRRFADVIRRQLELFEQDHRGVIDECIAAERAYDSADRDEAEERYGDYVDVVETGTEILAELRDAFARTLDEETAEEYEAAFNRAVVKRLPRFALEIENR